MVQAHGQPVWQLPAVHPDAPCKYRRSVLAGDRRRSNPGLSDTFLAGLADRYPETMRRFTHGEGAIDQFINQMAILASSPVERSESLTMREAIEVRQDALDDLRAMVSDNYRIEHGTLTSANTGEVPLPPDSDQAVHHRMTYLGDARWKYESVVPQSPDAAEIEPIKLKMEFLAKPGTPEHEAVQAWFEWGNPLEHVRVKTKTLGGPLFDDEPSEATVSIMARARDDRPTLYLRCTSADGESRFRLPLVVAALTVGAHTGWMRLVVDTPERALRFDLRLNLDPPVFDNSPGL